MPQVSFAYYRQPKKHIEGDQTFWLYRRGGYNASGGSYGRCGTRSEARDIIRRHWGIKSSFVRLFKPRFASMVEAGTKRQTIRPIPDRRPMPGDHISLRTWWGKPYRSKQRLLREATITQVQFVEICGGLIQIDGFAPADPDAFARADGFANLADMLAWFEAEHGLPFFGICIHW